jgi:hypothetical protein
MLALYPTLLCSLRKPTDTLIGQEVKLKIVQIVFSEFNASAFSFSSINIMLLRFMITRFSASMTVRHSAESSDNFCLSLKFVYFTISPLCFTSCVMNLATEPTYLY